MQVLRASDLSYVTQYGSTGVALTGNRGFNRPWDTTYVSAPQPTLYVSDRANARIVELLVKNISPDGRGEIITWRHTPDTDCTNAPANSRTTDIAGGTLTYVSPDECKSACQHNPLCDCFSYDNTTTCAGGTACGDYHKGTCVLKEGCWYVSGYCMCLSLSLIVSRCLHVYVYVSLQGHRQ